MTLKERARKEILRNRPCFLAAAFNETGLRRPPVHLKRPGPSIKFISLSRKNKLLEAFAYDPYTFLIYNSRPRSAKILMFRLTLTEFQLTVHINNYIGPCQ